MRAPSLVLVPVGVLLGACVASTAPTPIPRPSTVPEPVPAIAAPVQAPASPAATVIAAAPPTAANVADAELEARIPATVAGMDLLIISLTGADYLRRTPDSKLQSMIASTDLQADEVTIAIGLAESPDGRLAIAAFRFPGVAEGLLEDLFLGQLSEEIPGVSMDRATVSGHDVVMIIDPTMPRTPLYLEVEQDLVRLVQASTHVLANAALGALP